MPEKIEKTLLRPPASQCCRLQYWEASLLAYSIRCR